MIALLGLLLCLLISPNMAKPHSNAQELAVIGANSAFSNKLYTEIAKKKDGNLIYSPISAHTALAMCYQGAGGATLEAMGAGLGLESPEQAAKGYSTIMGRLNNVQKVTLAIANKVYLKEGFELQDGFAKSVKDDFKSEVQLVNFSENEKAAATINQWVEGKTNNKIKDLVKKDDLDDDTRLVLVNAIYFKGDWKEKFDKSNTQKKPFYLNDNDHVDVDMMYIKKKFRHKYDSELDAQVLELPYANEALSMIIVLPNTRTGLKALEQKLAQRDINNVTNGMYSTEVEVFLPRFKVESEIDLKKPLSNIGLANIFSNSADFSKMITGGEPLKVSKVIQKAFIEVNEEGAEAAAATAVMVAVFASFPPPPPPPVFNAEHPFVLFLIDQTSTTSKTILFGSQIVKPSTN